MTQSPAPKASRPGGCGGHSSDRPICPARGLVFGGICDSCAIWLNGEKLGEHKGMFAELKYDVSSKLRDGENTIIVRLDPAPQRIGSGEPNDFFIGMNVGWLNSAVINNIYGWHYINLPTIGIWRPVSLRAAPTVEIVDPFIAARDAAAGRMRLHLTFTSGADERWCGRLIASIEPENFTGEAFHFSLRFGLRGTGTRPNCWNSPCPMPGSGGRSIMAIPISIA